MVDSLQFKGQNYEVQQKIDNKMPILKCKYHENSIIEAININANLNNLLTCMKCVVLNSINSNNLVVVEELFSQESGQIIKNWPPLQDQKLYSILKSNDVQEEKNIQVISQIHKCFDTFKIDFLKIIDDILKKILSHINDIEDDRQKVIQTYNQISQKEEMKEQFINNQNNQIELESYLRKIIQIKQKQLTENEQKIRDSLDNLTKSQQKLQLNYIESILQQTLQNLQQIDLLDPHQSIQKLFSFKNKFIEEKKSEKSQILRNVDKIIFTINNRTNFSNSKVLNNFKDILIKNKQTILQLDFNEFLQEDESPMKQIIELNELKIHSNNNLEKQVQINSNQPLQSGYKIIRKNKVCNLQIIENLKNNNEINNNKIDLLSNINIIKSNIGNLNALSIKKIDFNCIKMENISNNEWGQLIINEKISPYTKYQIQFEFIYQNSGISDITFGLLPSSQKDSFGCEHSLSLNTCLSKYGIDKIEEGGHISQIRGYIRYITFQICLSQKIFRCLFFSDYQNNINSLSNWNYVKSHEQYYFYIGLRNYSKVELKRFEIVEEFEK